MNTINFFEADKAMSERVSEFFRCVVKKVEINTTYAEKIEKLENSIATTSAITESTIITKDEISAMVARLKAELSNVKSERDNLIEEQARFSYTEADKAFKKALKGKKDSTTGAITPATDDEVKTAIIEFFKVYKLDVTDSVFLERVFRSMNHKNDIKVALGSEGAKFQNWSDSQSLQNLYGVAFEAMVEAGTIKNAQIPELIRAKYAKKAAKKAKKAKKAN